MQLKSELVVRAFGQARISGLTSQPTPGEQEVGVNELEEMMHEWLARSLNLGYNFSVDYDVDINDEHNLPRWAIGGVIANLALRICDYFSKEPSARTVAKANSGLTVIKQKTYTPQDVSYPGRMPRGSGNTDRGYYFYRYYPKTFNPETDSVNRLYYQDVNNYTLDLSSYLIDNEIIDTVTVKSDDGISVTLGTATDDTQPYTVEGIKNGADNQQAVFTVTTDEGRQTTRIVYFTVIQKNLDNI